MKDRRYRCADKCPRKTAIIHHPLMVGVGPRKAKIMLIGEAPGQNEDREGIPFIGASGRLLTDTLEEHGLKRDEIYITNAVKCATPDENIKPKKKDMSSCAQYLQKEISLVKPNVIGVLGGVALQAVLDRTGITKLQNNIFFHEELGIKVIPVVHPAYVLRSPDAYSLFHKGIGIIAEESASPDLVNTAKVKTSHIDADTPKKIDKVLNQLEATDTFVFDLETTSLQIMEARIICIALSWEKGLGVTIKWDALSTEQLDRLSKIMRSKQVKVGHNLKYDIGVLLANKIKVRGPFFDTLLAIHLIDENIRDKSLDAMTLRYTDMGEYWQPLEEAKKRIMKERKIKKDDLSYDMIPYKTLQKYAQCDADATYRLYEIYKPELKRQNLYEFMQKYSIPTMQLLLEMEHKGIAVDREKLLVLIDEYREKEEAAAKAVLEEDAVKKYEKIRRKRAGRGYAKHWEEAKTLKTRFPDVDEYIETRIKDKDWKFNPKSPKQLAEILFKDVLMLTPEKFSKETKEPSTDEEVLTGLAEQGIPLAQKIIDHRKLSKFISTYLVSSYVLSEFDGRVHANFMQHVTVTGRLSCSDPNLQNIPRGAKDLKECFLADPGYTFVKADLGQAEFRCWAHYSRDTDMISDIEESGMDIHRKMASDLYGVPESEISKDDPRRTVAKASTFGLMFGRGPAAIAREHGMPIEQAKQLRTLFFERYPKATNWLKKQVAYAQEFKHVKTWMGRIRRLPDIDSENDGVRAEAERQATNAPIQGLASNMNDHFMVTTVKQARKKKLKFYPVLTQHDAQIYQVWESDVRSMMHIMKHVVDTAFPDFTCRMELDFEVGNTLGTLKKVAYGEEEE